MIPTLSTKHAFLIMLFLGLFAMTARNAIDPDLWWHLKTGEFIAEHKSVPHTDPFSYTRAGEPWVAHEWLIDLLLYQIQRTAGFTGLIVTFSAILCAAFFLLYLRCGSAPYVAAIATLCGAWATAPLWGVRPQVVSLLLTSIWLLILERSDRHPRHLWWTLPLTLLWVNLHAGFALGLVLSGLFLAGSLLESALGLDRPHASWKMSASILFLDLLLVPLNPNGARLFSYPLETLRSSAMQSYIVEWASPNFHHAEYWPLLLLILATFAVLSFSRETPRPRNLILLLISLYAALVSIRMIPLFVLIATPLISKRLGDWPRPSYRSHPSQPSSLFNVVLVLFMTGFTVVRVAHVAQNQPLAEAQHFPLRAAAFLEAHPPAGPIFNHYDWGGYLIWKLYPRTPVFIDGRADLYDREMWSSETYKPTPPNRNQADANSPHLDQPHLAQPDLDQQDRDPLRDFADLYQFKGQWRQVLDRWRIQTVIVPSDSALATGLLAAGWTVSYQDSQATILKASH